MTVSEIYVVIFTSNVFKEYTFKSVAQIKSNKNEDNKNVLQVLLEDLT